ncbi:MAG: 30S ribosomal protein S17 [Phycisphaerales bacterium]|jgi:small subunit ribosomal protein S17
METTKKIKTLTATVSSKSGIKSLRVTIDYRVKHPKYGKYVHRRTKLAVHDELNQCGVGDVVEISESRPYSKMKSWRVIRVLQKAVQA